jgi:predicted RNase H-like HicB family nuclease
LKLKERIFTVILGQSQLSGSRKSVVEWWVMDDRQVTKMSSVSILLENQQNGAVLATVLGLPNCHAEGATREAALANVQRLLAKRLARAELVSIDFPTENSELPMAGIFEHDPQWDEFQAAIADYRHELDAELLKE